MKRTSVILIFLSLLLWIGGCGKAEEQQGEIEEVYRLGLSQYLLEELELSEYDKKLQDSEMNYLPEKEEKQGEARQKDRLGLTYLYLRNDLHLERLTEKETKVLAAEAEQVENGEISNEAMSVIIRTFPDVISEREIEKAEDKEVMTMYDNNTDLVEVNALVLMIGTASEFDQNGNYVDKEHEVEKQKALQEFAGQMETELRGRLGDVPIRVRRDFSLFSENGNGFLQDADYPQDAE